MGRAKGCFKPAAIGCGVLFGLMALGAGIAALMAWRSVDDTDLVATDAIATAGRAIEQPVAMRGRIILNLAQGEFEILPAAPGQGLSLEARYDQSMYKLTEQMNTGVEPWEYRIDYQRTMPALQAMFRALMTDGGDTYFRLYLPPEVELDLIVQSEQGGLVAELGGLWLGEADFNCQKGGFVLSVDRPLKEPMRLLKLRGAMGGFNLSELGNASPAVLDIKHKMGGAVVDLGGEWRQDSDISIAVRMGGTSVSVPRTVQVIGTPLGTGGLQQDNLEVPIPILNFHVTQSMGEVDFSR